MPIEKVDELMKQTKPKSKHDDVWTTTELTQILQSVFLSYIST